MRVVECVLAMRNDNSEVKRRTLEQMKSMHQAHGSAMIHNEKTICLLSLDQVAALQQRKRDMLKRAVMSKKTPAQEFVIRRMSSSGVSSDAEKGHESNESTEAPEQLHAAAAATLTPTTADKMRAEGTGRNNANRSPLRGDRRDEEARVVGVGIFDTF